MFNLKNVRLNAEDVTANGVFILVAVADNHLFHDGKITDEIDGVKVTVATLPDFETVVVKITTKGSSELSNEKIRAKNSSGEFVKVKFQNFTAKVWQDFKIKDIHISATADDFEVLVCDNEANPIDFGN